MTGAAERASARGRVRSAFVVIGPAFVVAVAYVDPGNFATNMSAGAEHGYLLLWVVVTASLLAMFIQYQSAKLGVVTGRTLPELCRERFPRPVTYGLWAQAEIVAMATDLAEFVGAALALNLLFGMPLLPAAVLTAVVSFAVLALAPSSRRGFESIVVTMLAVVFGGFLYQALQLGPISGMGEGLVPAFAGMDSVLLATGMLGATVMPHVIYLHSALTRRFHVADPVARKRVLRTGFLDIGVALGVAALVNIAMLVVAAEVFHGLPNPPESLTGLHHGLGTLLGSGAAVAFALALLASGLASASVGTYSGQVIMEGFLRRRIPLTLRRLVTMAPPLGVLALGVDPTEALVLSQVVLSFGIPFALVPLTMLTARRDVMGVSANRSVTTVVAIAASVLISGLNGVLLFQVFSG